MQSKEMSLFLWILAFLLNVALALIPRVNDLWFGLVTTLLIAPLEILVIYPESEVAALRWAIVIGVLWLAISSILLRSLLGWILRPRWFEFERASS